MSTTSYSIEKIRELADGIAAHYAAEHTASELEHIRVYGVPRGGVAVAYEVRDSLIRAGWDAAQVTYDADEATVIVDDIIDSGNTARTFNKLYPATPFYGLMQANGGGWVTFPWERGLDNASGAEDIPVRLLQYIGEDVTRGGLRETPQRFLKAWLEYTMGYHVNPAELLKTFEDGAEHVDEMVVVRDIPVYSHCEHHLAPFFGVAHVAYIPNGKVVGLSKLARVVNAFSRRLQVQERLTQQVAHAIDDALQPRGVGVIVECRHMCMEARGIRAAGTTTRTSCLLGVMRSESSARSEFLGLAK